MPIITLVALIILPINLGVFTYIIPTTMLVYNIFTNYFQIGFIDIIRIILNIKISPIVLTAFIITMISIPVFVWVFDRPEDEFYLQLYGSEEMTMLLNNVYLEPGYKAYDSIDGDLTGSVLVTGSVNYKELGDYVLTYTVTNSRKQTIEKIRKVKVVKDDSILQNKGNYNVIEIVLDDFNAQIDKGKVYDGINIQTSKMLNQYINKFMLQKHTVYAVSLTSIVKDNNRYSSIYNCDKRYANTEASGMIATNGTLERIYNTDNNCFDNYGVFYFTKDKMHYTRVNSEEVSQSIVASKTRNTFVYQDVIVDNGSIINNSEIKTKNNAICQSSSNTLKLFNFKKEFSYQEIGDVMIKNNCQTGILLTDGDTILHKPQSSSTINVKVGTDNLTDSIIFFYPNTK